jgi:hypothetical protein
MSALAFLNQNSNPTMLLDQYRRRRARPDDPDHPVPTSLDYRQSNRAVFNDRFFHQSDSSPVPEASMSPTQTSPRRGDP